MNPLQQIEQETLEEGRELTRRMLEERLQLAIDEMGAISPASGLKLKRARRIGLKLHTVCGVVELRAWYGFCSHSGRNLSPARERWGSCLCSTQRSRGGIPDSASPEDSSRLLCDDHHDGRLDGSSSRSEMGPEAPREDR